jgi:glycine betaine/proline transport system ATP-binding protein
MKSPKVVVEGLGKARVFRAACGPCRHLARRRLDEPVDQTDQRVIIGGRDIAAARPSELTSLRRTDMSMVFQSFALMPQRTVLSMPRSASSCRRRPAH